ncbi:heme peroxidase [Cantharellus anzutake]|uniref:heme peroxidase n=1 Tax=Cantharellus anzutake TaxID=1750568 RepID=UPI0019072830|nr:heme peroxidase [Cantharellus anzutake]KAF8337099.1 heme peroxidase [Cantharellus anzutake]
MSHGQPKPSTALHAALRTIDNLLEDASLTVQAINRSWGPLPKTTEDFKQAEATSMIASDIEAVRAQIKRGLPIEGDPGEIAASVLDVAKAGSPFATEGIHDRKFALEYILTFLSRADPRVAGKVEHLAIRTLYYDLSHPPATNMGQKYQFRSADGSGNSAYDPDMGKAFSPYSRSCSGSRPLPDSELPDPGLVYDAIIKRDPTKFTPHPAGYSGLFFNFATFVVHSVFRTSRTDFNINETSSYVDLGILYGNTQAHQDKIRYVDGRGRILPDVYAEFRLINLPPAVNALIILFSRNHNYIADMLLRINERETWTQDIQNLNKESLVKQDYEIFNTARLINSATFAFVILGDYLAAILGTVRDGSSWTLDISDARRESDHQLLGRGRGNSCSVEFNTLYRWHSGLSAEDAEYNERVFQYLFAKEPGVPVDFDKITPADFEYVLGKRAMAATYSRLRDKDGKPAPLPDFDHLTPRQVESLIDDSKPVDYLLDQWSFKGFSLPGSRTFERNPRDPKTKRYKDDLLANALLSATSVPAHIFGARGVPGALRVIEILGIQQARSWGTCSLNEFRRFLGLEAYSTFEEWNSDKEVAEAARKLYGTTENLELYVGLVAEEAKPVRNGSGLCPSYTVSRAILADAVALVRGDRYLTFDFTPFNLTTWGFAEANRNITNAAWGGVLGRLLARGLPRHYDATSVYTHFPLITPKGQPYSMDHILAKLGEAKEFTFDKPTKKGILRVVVDPKDVEAALGDPPVVIQGLVTQYVKNVKDIGLTPSFLTVIDDAAAYARVTALVQDYFVPASELEKNGKWFYEKACQLIRENSYTVHSKAPKRVDVVKEVLRIIPVHWAAQVAGLPVKTAQETRGIYYEQQMYQMLKEIYSYIFLEPEPSLKIPNQREARENVDRLRRFVKLSLTVAKGGLSSSVLGGLASIVLGEGNQSANPILKRLLALGSPTDELANDIIAVISSAIELSQVFTHVINFYLPQRQEVNAWKPSATERTTTSRGEGAASNVAAVAARGGDEISLCTLEGYVLEALRFDPVTPGVYRVATTNIRHMMAMVSSAKGDRFYFDFTKAAVDSNAFDDAYQINPHRHPASYTIYGGDGVFKTLGQKFVVRVTAEVLRAVFELRNVQRTLGKEGILRRFKEPVVTVDDIVTVETTQVPFMEVDSNGVLVDTLWTEEVNVYKLQSGISREEGKIPAERWAYLDPEIGHHPSTWATGLTIEYYNELASRG